MKRVPLLWLTLSLVLCALVALPAHRAMADNETDELEFRVEGTLEAVDCTAQTVKVLGLTVGIGGARLDTANDVCTDFVVGEQVEVKLASDIPNASGNLKAGRVRSRGNSGSPPRLKAPIQEINAGKTSLTLLGKKVDISQGNLEGMDDHMHANHNVPADPSQLIVGQFVQVRLVDGTPPLVAEEIEIENFKNEVEVELENEHGVEIHDLVEIEVHNHTVILVPANASPLDGAAARRPKTRVFKSKSRGKFTLHGLFTGEAKIIIERNVNGHKNRVARLVKVRGDRTGHLKVRLRDN